MNNKSQVILARAHWCRFCEDFIPIFNKAKDDYSDKYEFHNYDFADNTPSPNKQDFINKYGGSLVDKIKGYPTIFLKIDEDGKDLYIDVNSTIIKNNDLNKAVKDFIKNIDNSHKTLLSDRKKEIINLNGGFNNESYKHKYMKYKEKYYKLKNNL